LAVSNEAAPSSRFSGAPLYISDNGRSIVTLCDTSTVCFYTTKTKPTRRITASSVCPKVGNRPLTAGDLTFAQGAPREAGVHPVSEDGRRLLLTCTYSPTNGYRTVAVRTVLITVRPKSLHVTVLPTGTSGPVAVSTGGVGVLFQRGLVLYKAGRLRALGPASYAALAGYSPNARFVAHLINYTNQDNGHFANASVEDLVTGQKRSSTAPISGGGLSDDGRLLVSRQGVRTEGISDLWTGGSVGVDPGREWDLIAFSGDGRTVAYADLGGVGDYR
jgi:hypothetical protein